MSAEKITTFEKDDKINAKARGVQSPARGSFASRDEISSGPRLLFTYFGPKLLCRYANLAPIFTTLLLFSYLDGHKLGQKFTGVIFTICVFTLDLLLACGYFCEEPCRNSFKNVRTFLAKTLQKVLALPNNLPKICCILFCFAFLSEVITEGKKFGVSKNAILIYCSN